MDTNTSLQQDAQAQCVECGNAFSVNDMIRHGSAYICVNCKPRFMQKLVEGADIHVGLRYAGFWLRFLAQFLDSLLLGIVNFGIQMVALISIQGALNGGAPPTATPLLTPLMISYGLSFLIAITYEGMMVGKYGATLGKMACKLKVVKPDGTPVSYGRAFGRYFARWLSVLTFLIGYIIAAFDSEKRSLHDRVCNTRVVITN